MLNPPSLSDVITRFNSLNLSHLLRFCSGISILEVCAPSDYSKEIQRFGHFENVRLLSDAIIASKAADYKQKKLRKEHLSYVINGLVEAGNDPRLEQEVPNFQERTVMQYRLTRYFARMANFQFMQQDLYKGNTALWGRMIAIFDDIPVKGDFDSLPGWKRKSLFKKLGKIRELLGCQVWELALIHAVIQTRLFEAGSSVWSELLPHLRMTKKRSPKAIIRSVQLMQLILREEEDLASSFVFSETELETYLQNVSSPELVRRYLEIFSRPIKQQREHQQRLHRFGVAGWQLSTLSRFPLVRTDAGEYIVPNFRVFFRSFEGGLDHHLRSNLGNDYSEYLGAAQECYLQRLIQTQLPNYVAIPEKAYTFAGVPSLDGPDLTLVDQEEQEVILVESKARKAMEGTKATMWDGFVDRNYEGVLKALLLLPTKLEHLRSIPEGEYKNYESELRQASGCAPFVCVVGEDVYFLTELLRHRKVIDPNSPSGALENHAFCVMDLEKFELLVGIAQQKETSLGELLRQYWKHSEDLDLQKPRTNTFGDEFRPVITMYGETVWKEYFERAVGLGRLA